MPSGKPSASRNSGRTDTLFASAETAQQTDLKTALYAGGFQTTRSDGDLSRDDVEAFARKEQLLRTLAPWAIVLDSATGRSPNREITDREIDALLTNPTVPNDVKLAVIEVFGTGSGVHQAELFIPPSSISLPPLSGVPTISPTTPSAMPTDPPRGPSPPWVKIVVSGFVSGYMIAKWLSDPDRPTEIVFFDPATGSRKTVSTDLLGQYDTNDLDRVIQVLVATGELPSPKDLTHVPPDTYIDPNGDTRNSETGDLADPLTGETYGIVESDQVSEMEADQPVWKSTDDYVAPAANAIELAFPGRITGVNTIRQHVTRSGFREVDIELDGLVIQVKGGKGGGLIGQIDKTKETLQTSVIGFAPEMPTAAVTEARKQGHEIARTIPELLSMIEDLT